MYVLFFASFNERIIGEKIKNLGEEIIAIKKLSQSTPINPDSSLGRITRMDAIHSKDVYEQMIHKMGKKLSSLKKAQKEIDHDHFGKCEKCGREIPWQRLQIKPTSIFCVKCS